MNEPSETPPAAARPAGARPFLWIALAALLVLAAGAWWKLQGATTPGAAAAVAPPTVTVSQPLHKEIVEWDEYTGQFAAVDEYLTGRENVEMVGRLYGLSRGEARRRAGDVLERIHLAEVADRHR